MAQIAWGYIELGTTLVRAYVRDDGAVCTAAGSVIDDDVIGALWKTRRSIDQIIGELGVHTSTSTIALVGPNGGMTDIARAISNAPARNAGVYTLEELLAKCGEKLDVSVVEAFYGAEVEAAA